MKRLLFLISVISACCVSCTSSDCKNSDNDTINNVLNDTSATLNILNDTTPICIIGVGDIMLGTNYPSNDYLPAGDNCEKLLSNVADILKSGDITVGNLEGVYLNSGGIVKQCSDPSVCYAFRTPDKYFSCIVNAGFDLLNLANNHTGDFGIEGRNNTVKVIEEAGLLYAGLLSKPYTILEKNGLKYGFCGFAPNSGTCDLRDIPEAQRIVKLLEETCNVVIVSIHGGAEGSRAQNVTRQTEWYVGENRGNIYEIAHKLVDAGADIIFAHGPHVPRAVEIYNNRLIAYSLGNFCTYSRMNIKGVLGYAPILKVWVQNDGQFLNGEIISAIQIEKQGTKIDSLQQAYLLIKQLTNKDFPDHNIIFEDNGTFYLKK